MKVMITVEFLGPIGRESMELNAKNLDELSSMLKNDAEIAAWLDKCAVAINDELINSRDRELQEGDRVSLLPPVCGG
jgi:molybdopterin synthase sulfur carrier subunit